MVLPPPKCFTLYMSTQYFIPDRFPPPLGSDFGTLPVRCNSSNSSLKNSHLFLKDISANSVFVIILSHHGEI